MNALNAYNKLNANVAGLKKASEKLSSGYRINRAGDDAAGLAISEKMRSQIRGLNQAKRNAQDGISMIQTFEGAAQETHTILQRMKELATESANGTYDDPTDRAAIQLEFDQLNDELNQLADTDFNGTIVLNGGEMSDGLKAVDGEFNYANNTKVASQLSADDVNKVDYQAFDNTGSTKGVTKADDVWYTISGNKWDRSDPTKDQGPDSVDVTLKYDKSSGKWNVESATNGADITKFTATETDNGGFKLTDGTNEIANIVMDSHDLINGDTLVLTLNNPKAPIAAPTNAGAVVTDSSGYTESGKTGSSKAQDMDLKVETLDAVDDAAMTESIKKVFDAFDGADFNITYASKKAFADAATGIDIKLKDGTAVNFKGNSTTDVTGSLSDGTQFALKIDTGVIKVYAGANSTDGTEILNITPKAHDAADESAGTISYKIGLDYKDYNVSQLPTVEVKNPDGANVSKANSFENSTARMNYTDNITLQVGARTKDAVNFTFNYNADGSADMGTLKANLNLSSRADGLNTANLSLANAEDANYAIDQIDKAINKTSMVRASFGAVQNRLDYKIENLTTTSENLTEAESNIRDTDMANEMLNYTKFNILQQAAQSMLAQANQQPQSILQLLG